MIRMTSKIKIRIVIPLLRVLYLALNNYRPMLGGLSSRKSRGPRIV
jgi:hypothetical protein